MSGDATSLPWLYIAGKVQWARVKASVVLMVMLLASLSRVSPSDFPLSGRLSILV
jgi:hypothetical protein